eukprot:Selendium_serpulae@DN6345_c1_g1_i6.p1
MKCKGAQLLPSILLLISVLTWVVWQNSQTSNRELSPFSNVTSHVGHDSPAPQLTPGCAECVKDESCYQCDIGPPPFDMDWILSELNIFKEVFRKSPRQQNTFGTQIPDQTALWCFLRHFRPKHIIESGALNGLGTWLIRQAAPEAQLTVISPEHPAIWVDSHEDTVYYTDKRFRDISELQDELRHLEKENTIVFFDDHQSHSKRLKEMRAMGFKNILFDDNYIPGTKDSFSMKQGIFEDFRLHHLLGVRPNICYDGGKKCEDVTWDELLRVSREMVDMVEVYFEFPPIWDKSDVVVPSPRKSRFNYGNWKLLTPKNYRLFTKPPILQDAGPFSVELMQEQKHYYEHFCFVKLL